MVAWTTIAGPIASLMIEKYLRKNNKNRLRNKDSKTSLKNNMQN
jgi:ribosomal protein S20